jgi:cytochrome P450
MPHMAANTLVLLNGAAAARWYLQFFRDPLKAMLRGRATHGPFFQLPHLRFPTEPPRKFVVAMGAGFNEEVLHDPAAWRTVSIAVAGPRGSAARRLGMGIIRMTGRPHAHYRRLLVPPLHRKSVAEMGAQMVRLAEDEVASWPMNEVIDLWAHVQKLLRTFAIGLLFGGDRPRGYSTAELIGRFFDFNWSWKVAACPVSIAGTPYRRMLGVGEQLERSILEWADCKRGQPDGRDLLSIIVNSPDEDGCPASNDKIVGHAPTLLAAAYETCQNALIWTLILLEQHPRVATDLLDELLDAPLTFDQLVQLPLLDAVVKESMRILPPVPQQFRVAERDVTLAGHAMPQMTRVALSALVTNRHPELYPEPDRFKPERWKKIEPSPYEYLVFSAGPRGCPGYWFGLCAIKSAIAAIFSRYRIALVPGSRIDYKVRVALSPRNRVDAVLHRQDGAFEAAPIRGGIRDLVQLPH